MLTVIGEALVDIVRPAGREPRAHPGGSPLNVAVGVSRLGHRTAFIGRYGRDEHGRSIEEHLAESGVVVPLGADERPTSVAEAEIAEDGAAQYQFQLDWTLDGAQEQLSQILAGTGALHVGSIGAMLEPGASTVLGAVREAAPHALVSYDPNCRPTIIPDSSQARAWAEAVIEHADLVKASDEDLLWLYPQRTVEESARAWCEAGPRLVVLTRGKLGPWALHESTGPQGIRVDPPAVEVADTVGAGDSMMAGLLSALLDRSICGEQARDRLAALDVETLRAVVEEAAAAAAITVSRPGADPPTREELAAFRSR